MKVLMAFPAWIIKWYWLIPANCTSREEILTFYSNVISKIKKPNYNFFIREILKQQKIIETKKLLVIEDFQEMILKKNCDFGLIYWNDVIAEIYPSSLDEK